MTSNMPIRLKIDVAESGVEAASRRLEISRFLADTYRFIQEEVLPPFNWPAFAMVLERYWARRTAGGTEDIDFLPLAACLAAGGTLSERYQLRLRGRCIYWLAEFLTIWQIMRETKKLCLPDLLRPHPYLPVCLR